MHESIESFSLITCAELGQALLSGHARFLLLMAEVSRLDLSVSHSNYEDQTE